jgi:hypothetical protein
MDIKILEEKERIYKEAHNSYLQEFSQWDSHAKQIIYFFNKYKKALFFSDNKYKLSSFSYRVGDSISLKTTEDTVTISITDFEKDFMGSANLKLDDFLSDNWEEVFRNEIENLIEIEKQEKIINQEKKKDKDYQEYLRLKTIYEK